MKRIILSGLICALSYGAAFAAEAPANFKNYLAQKKELESAVALYRKDQFPEALLTFNKLIKSANPLAEYYYAACLAAGNGLPKRAEQAGEIYTRIFPQVYAIAKKGDAFAQNVLAVMRSGGKGVKKNEAESLKWLRKAADQGYAPAQYNLGTRYLTARAWNRTTKKR